MENHGIGSGGSAGPGNCVGAHVGFGSGGGGPAVAHFSVSLGRVQTEAAYVVMLTGRFLLVPPQSIVGRSVTFVHYCSHRDPSGLPSLGVGSGI